MAKKQKDSGGAGRPKLGMAGLLRPHWLMLTLAMVAVLGETLGDILQPWPVKIVIDNVLQSKKLPWWLEGLVPSGKNGTLDLAIAAVLLIAVVSAVSGYFDKYLTTSVSQWVSHDLRLALYHHLQRLSLSEHDQSQRGDLITRVTKDIDTVQDFISSALFGIVINVLTLVGMIVVMFFINWRFTLIALSVAPVLLVTVYFYTPRIKKASRAVKKKEAELLSEVAETFSFIHVVQAFAREDYEDRRFAFESRENVEAGLAARSLKARLSPIVEVITAAGTALVLFYGARLALTGQMSAGVLVVFLLYLKQMYKPMKDLSKMTDTLSKAAIGFERIQEVLDVESRIRDLPGAKLATAFKGAIEFDHVSFGYDAGTPILTDVTFRIEPGQVAAVVGASGTGKTTMVSLIPRFYEPLKGHVRIDSTDVREFTLKSLRDQISFVLQDTLLFRATIWENIAYGKPDASIEDTIEAAQRANAHDFIVGLPQGYATMVGERGVTLSGGQRQRIAIARAIVRNTPILILDEPTSGLDAASEQAVIEALDHLMKGRTSVMIAHHLSTIRHADVIFVLDGSQLVEQGTHEALLARGGRYAELHRIQHAGIEV